jgi:nucleotide-binding universal stress UspA family protein
MLTIRTILHPTDFSSRSTYAFHLACSLARDHGARLVLVHVVSPPAVAYGEMITDFAIDEAREEARRGLDKLVVSDANIKVERLVVDGEPVTEILRVAGQNAADLIVMGTHGRSGLSRLLLGSVAEAVLRKATCPVLTVKTPMTEAAPS